MIVNPSENNFDTRISLNRGLTSGDNGKGCIGLHGKLNDNVLLEYFDYNFIVNIYVTLNLITGWIYLQHKSSIKRNILE